MSLLHDLFITVVNMSITASYVAIGVILVRLLLKKAPKIFSYILWTPVLFRLICPFSFTSVFSFLSLINLNERQGRSMIEYVPQNIDLMQAPAIQSGIGSVDNAINASLPHAIPYASVNPMQIRMAVMSLVWVTGVVALLIYSIISYLRTKRRLRTATLVEENVFETDAIGTAFVYGFISPKIYVPVNVRKSDLSYILEHERTHIKRCDYLIKPFAFLALILHWFNPLMWLSFVLMSRDMEMSCDESVLHKLGDSAKGSYSETLLSLSLKRKGLLVANPLAFCESHVTTRIKNVLHFKKPPVQVIMIVIVAICVAVIAFVANPKDKGTESSVGTEHTFEIYLVTMPEEGFYRLAGDEIDTLLLEKEPILTDKDFIAYHWGIKEHKDNLEIRDGVSVYERLRGKGFKNVGAGMYPFVVVCNGDRIYLGVFSSHISSLAVPKYASVYFNTMVFEQNTYEISALKDESLNLLHDKRIYNTLDMLKILKDYTLDAVMDEEGGDDSSTITNIETILEKINERQVVEEIYFRYLGDNTELVDMLRDHNKLTAFYYEFFYNRAKNTMIAVLNLETEDGALDRSDLPDDFDEMIERIARYSLYKNCTQMFLDDPVLYPIIEKEAGGSAGQWPYWWHTLYLNDLPEVKEGLASYFELEEELVKQLENL